MSDHLLPLLDRGYRRFDEAVEQNLDAYPVISTHNEPQVSPQEWDCGCVSVTYVTDRDFLRGEQPFEMRLASACKSSDCQTEALIAESASCQSLLGL